MTEHEIEVLAGDGVRLPGTLALRWNTRAVVLFAHGSGSGRDSPRNRYVARVLQDRGLATLLIDLLSADEDTAERGTPQLRFDIELLAERLLAATAWIRNDARTRTLAIGYFGASTGSAAALVAAAQAATRIGAVVSRGGRPDLAAPLLSQVRAPTLLIVGGDDVDVAEMNRAALGMLACEKKLVVIPGAGHLFEEPGALEEVAELAADWFAEHLGAGERTREPARAAAPRPPS